ncbi:MAG: Lrp/AsnC family transcriptional regulator [Nanoarchaeota archaeon]|nr:Lrp/AsnC family transcriptional regulator [Nanoarchaeota archaeon]MBU1632534.1 Lrp/AsnC family transcriptional regulator [Nanoarchaeota archaeon]MBU1875694.1 Lrp/AsnC family transcriptional regulator [Nanoarchaeota archaeon]
MVLTENNKTIILLTNLRKNSREKLTTISKRTNIPISTLFDELKKLEDNIILRKTILIDFSKLGYHVKAQVFLKVDENNKDKLKRHLICNENVNTIYRVNNGWDFIIETAHKNIQDLDGLLENISKNFIIQNKQIHYLVEDIKKEGILLN